MTTTAAIVDLNQVIGERKVGFFHINLLLWTFIAMLADGFDMQAMPYIGSAIVSAFHVERAALGPAFSASFIGILVGAPIFGVLGDHYGRKIGAIISLSLCAVFMFVTTTAQSLDELIAYRFLTGFGIGGAFPNLVALVVEFAPKRMRAAFVIIIFFGLVLGTMLPGYVATALVASHGWQAVFFVGGILSIIGGASVLFGLPESIKYLAVQDRQAAVAHILRKLDPTLLVGAATRFVVPSAVKAPTISPAKLFSPGLALTTILVWIMCFLTLGISFMFASWMPVLLQANGVSLAQASSVVALFFMGSIFGGFVHLFSVDRYGSLPVAIMLLISAPLVASIGLFAPGSTEMMVLAFITGICMMGAQPGINALTGLMYPTAIRGNGAGWAQAIGRAGSSLGPIMGGLFVGMNVSLQAFLLAPAVGALFGALAAFALARVCVRRFGSYRVEEESADEHGSFPMASPVRP
jgi:MFS transporter, AAHS family, 4-hydroxybenzoate transporter